MYPSLSGDIGDLKSLQHQLWMIGGVVAILATVIGIWLGGFSRHISERIEFLKSQEIPARVVQSDGDELAPVGMSSVVTTIIYAKDDEEARSTAAQLKEGLSGLGWKIEEVLKAAIPLEPGVVIQVRKRRPGAQELQEGAASALLTSLTKSRIKAEIEFAEVPVDSLRVLVGPNVLFPDPAGTLGLTEKLWTPPEPKVRVPLPPDQQPKLVQSKLAISKYKPEALLAADFTIRNDGGTPAHINNAGVVIDTWAGTDATYVENAINRVSHPIANVLKPGDTWKVPVPGGLGLSPKQFEDIEQGKGYLWCVSRIAYTDLNGNEGEARFAWKYVPKLHKFLPEAETVTRPSAGGP
jgi:hypothetical protein